MCLLYYKMLSDSATPVNEYDTRRIGIQHKEILYCHLFLEHVCLETLREEYHMYFITTSLSRHHYHDIISNTVVDASNCNKSRITNHEIGLYLDTPKYKFHDTSVLFNISLISYRNIVHDTSVLFNIFLIIYPNKFYDTYVKNLFYISMHICIYLSKSLDAFCTIYPRINFTIHVFHSSCFIVSRYLLASRISICYTNYFTVPPRT